MTRETIKKQVKDEGMQQPPYQFIKAADGVHLRCNYWRCRKTSARGTFLILGGRGEFMEKYQETIEEINRRGFNAFSFDWRGQGGSQRLLADASKGYVQSYDHYLSDLEQMIGVLDARHCPKPWFILAHSMGSHIALHYLGRQANKIDAAILTAPMVDINTSPMPRPVLQWLSRYMVRKGRQGILLPSTHRNDVLNSAFKSNRVTSDPERFFRVQQMLRKQPELAVGGVTYGWLAATFDAIDTLHAPGFAQGVDLPVLMVLAGADQVVLNAAALDLSASLPQKEIMVIHEARHEILQERDEIRLQFWRELDIFLGKTIGMDDPQRV